MQKKWQSLATCSQSVRQETHGLQDTLRRLQSVREEDDSDEQKCECSEYRRTEKQKVCFSVCLINQLHLQTVASQSVSHSEHQLLLLHNFADCKAISSSTWHFSTTLTGKELECIDSESL